MGQSNIVFARLEVGVPLKKTGYFRCVWRLGGASAAEFWKRFQIENTTNLAVCQASF